MKTAQQFDQDSYLSAKDHKSKAANLRRLSSGAEAAAKSAAQYGLSEQDTKTLNHAAEILGRMAGLNAQAKSIKEKRVAEHAAREKKIVQAMKGNFAAISDIPGQVALIAATDRHSLENLKKHTLKFYVDIALGQLSYRLASEENKSNSAEALVKDLWDKFLSKRPEYEAAYQQLIAELSRL